MTAKGVRQLLLTGTAALVSIGTAQAQSTTTPYGTLAGTSVTNTAQATYTVNGNPGNASSNESKFVVDRKVNLTVVVDQPANTQVNLSQQGAVTRFKVTNNTNGTQDFLVAAAQSILPIGILPGNSNFSMGNLHVVVDDGDGIYDAQKDTATWIDELAPDASRVVYIVGDVPNQQDAQLSVVGLDVTTAAGGAPNTKGDALVASILNTDGLDVVFADDDNDGTLGLDTARNGQGWAYLGYEIGTRTLNVTINKTATVLSDGVNTLNPKAIPGAVVQYCLTVNNATLTTAATALNLTDVIPANTTYVPGSIQIGSVGLLGACIGLGYQQADDGSNVTGPYRGSFDSTTKKVTMIVPTLNGGGTVAASFQVKIN